MARLRSSAPRCFALAISLVAVLALGLGAVPAAAPAAAEHRALVIVDTGSTVYRRVVTFGEDSISGIAALQRAGADPVLYTYSGQGGGVCRLFGVGRDAGPGCLGGADGDARYWAYFRAPAGSSGFTYSRAGAGSTAVHDGDVEGWKFGTGSAPPFSPVPPPAPPATGAPPGAPTGAVGGTGGGATIPASPTNPNGAPSPPGTPGSPGATTPTAAPGTTPSSLPATGGPSASAAARTHRSDASASRAREAVARHRAQAASGSSSGGGSGPGPLLLLGGLLVALGVAVALVRRARRGDGGSAPRPS